MTRSHLLLLAFVLAANYLLMVARHEGCHALVAFLSGADMIDSHLWPPQGWNLSWTTVVSLSPRPPWVIRLQATLPYLVDLAFVAASLIYLLSIRVGGFWRLNVALTGIVFPLADLSLSVGAYWFADNDYFFVFGPGRLFVRATLSTCVLVLMALCGWLVVRGAGNFATVSEASGAEVATHD